MNPDATCPFCQIVAGTQRSDVVYRDEQVIVFLPDEPATRGHVLVAPIEHIPDIWHLDTPSAETLGSTVLQVAKATRSALPLDGLNVIQSNGEAATQSVFHLHIHVLPRYVDDRIVNFWPIGSAISDEDRAVIAGQLAARINNRTSFD